MMTNLEKKQSKFAKKILIKKLELSWPNGCTPVMYMRISQAYRIPYNLVHDAGPRARKSFDKPVRRIMDEKQKGNFKRVIGLKPVRDKEELILFEEDLNYFIQQQEGIKEIVNESHKKARIVGLITGRKFRKLYLP